MNPPSPKCRELAEKIWLLQGFAKDGASFRADVSQLISEAFGGKTNLDSRPQGQDAGANIPETSAGSIPAESSPSQPAAPEKSFVSGYQTRDIRIDELTVGLTAANAELERARERVSKLEDILRNARFYPLMIAAEDADRILHHHVSASNCVLQIDSALRSEKPESTL